MVIYFPIQIPNNAFYLQPISYTLMPFCHQFQDQTANWSYNQSHYFQYSQPGLGTVFLINYMGQKINGIEPKQSLVTKQRFQHIQKKELFNQNSQKSSPLKCCASSLSFSRQFNFPETGQEGICEKQRQEKKDQKLMSSTQKQVSEKCEFNVIKQNSKQKIIFNSISNKNINNSNQSVKTEAIHVQLQKVSKQKNHWKRTILPNMYQVIFAYLTRRQKSQHRVKRLFERIEKPNKKMSQNYSLQSYFQYQKLLKQKLVYCQNQLKFSLLRQIHDPHCSNFQLEEQMYYNKVSRIVVRDFIENELKIQLLQKDRTRRKQKDEQEFCLRHMEIYRKIKGVFKKTFTI